MDGGCLRIAGKQSLSTSRSFFPVRRLADELRKDVSHRIPRPSQPSPGCQSRVPGASSAQGLSPAGARSTALAATLKQAAPVTVPAGALSDIATPRIARGGFPVGPARRPLNEATGIQRPGRLAQARKQRQGQHRNEHTKLQTSLHDPFLRIEPCRESPGR